MTKVAILMSTYNGEKFIKEQIRSILNQKNVELELFIRDDGSKDNTINIINDFNNAKIHLKSDKNIGYVKSFSNLIWNEEINADFYAFADQDDIWMENKLISGINKINDLRIPAMTASNSTLFGESVPAGKRLYSKNKDSLPFPIYNGTIDIFLNTNYFGHTIIFNKDAYKLIKQYEPKILSQHDRWIPIVISLFGKIIYDDSSYTLYRQHNTNAIGASAQKTSIIHKIKTFLNVIPVYSNDAKELLNGYSHNMNDVQKSLFFKVAHSKKVKNKLLLLFNKKFKRKNFYDTVILKIFILIGKI